MKRKTELSRVISAWMMVLCIAVLCLPSPVDAAAKDAKKPVDTQAEENKTTEWKDVAYGTLSGKQKMDIYLPSAGKGPYPVILAFHGRHEDKTGPEMEAPLMGLSRGYAVACVNYREAEEARFPADVMDAKAAVRFLKANASKYHLDGSHVAAWGDSFGGKLAAFIGTTSSHRELDDLSVGPRGQSSRVKAAVVLFPALDEVHMDSDFKSLGITPALLRNEEEYGMEMYGAPIQSIPNLVAFHDPTRYISAEAVPFFIEHGTADNVCPITQSERFADRLRHTIGSSNVTFVSLEGAGHHVKDFMGKENMDKIFRFLDKHMKVKEKKSGTK